MAAPLRSWRRGCWPALHGLGPLAGRDMQPDNTNRRPTDVHIKNNNQYDRYDQYCTTGDSVRPVAGMYWSGSGTGLYCTVLYGYVLVWSVLYGTVLVWSVLVWSCLVLVRYWSVLVMSGAGPVLVCTVLYWSVNGSGTGLYCTVLLMVSGTGLYCTVTYCTVWHWSGLYCTVWHWSGLVCTGLYCTVPAVHRSWPPVPRRTPFVHRQNMHATVRTFATLVPFDDYGR